MASFFKNKDSNATTTRISESTTAHNNNPDQWKVLQKKVFTAWINAYLKQRGIFIQNVYEDFQDGISLLILLEILSGEDIKIPSKKPKMAIHKMENLKKAFDFMKSKGIPLLNIGAEDISKSNEKIILALLWVLIMHFQLGTVGYDGISGKEGLLLWCQRLTMNYPNVAITNFNKSWSNGLAFAALLHKTDGKCGIPEFDEMFLEMNPLDRLKLTFQCAEEKFDIPHLLDPEDICGSAKPDDKIIITYLCFYFKEISRINSEAANIKSISMAIDITKKHQEYKLQYDSDALQISEWIDNQFQRFDENSITKGTTGNSSTTTLLEIKGKFDNLIEYKNETKPNKKGEITKLEGFLNTYTASCRNNSRPIYQVPESLSINHLKTKWQNLSEQEGKYETSLQKNYTLFQQLDSILARVSVKIDKQMEWLNTTRNDFLLQGDLGTSLTTAKSFLDNVELCTDQFQFAKDLPQKLNEMLSAKGIDLHSGKLKAMKEMEILNETTVLVEKELVEYQRLLIISKEEFAKVLMLDNIESWIERELIYFSKDIFQRKNLAGCKEIKKYVDTLFKSELARYQQKISTISVHSEAEHVGLKDILESTNQRLELLKKTSEDFDFKLQERKDFLEGLNTKNRDFNRLAAEFTLNVEFKKDDLCKPVIATSIEDAKSYIDDFNKITAQMEKLTSEFTIVDEIGIELEKTQEEEAQSAFARYHLTDIEESFQSLKDLVKTREKLLKDPTTGLLQEEMIKEDLRLLFGQSSKKFREYLTSISSEIDGIDQSEIEEAVLNKTITKLKEMIQIHETKVIDIEEMTKVERKLQQEYHVMHNKYTPETVANFVNQYSTLRKKMDKLLNRKEELIGFVLDQNRRADIYAQISTKMKDTIAEKLQEFLNVKDGKDGYGNTMEDIKQTLKNFEDYQKDVKGAHEEQLNFAIEFLETLHADQAKISRKLYIPSENLSSASLMKYWNKLCEQEVKYQHGLISTFNHFERLENTIQSVEAKIEKTNIWMNSYLMIFEAADLGANYSACLSLIDNYEIYQKQMKVQSEIPQIMNTWIEKDRIEVHADCDKIKNLIKDLEANIGKTASTGDVYLSSLHKMQDEFEHLNMLITVEQWTAQVSTLFETVGELSSLEKINTLLEQHEELYTNQLSENAHLLEQVHATSMSVAPQQRKSIMGVAAQIGVLQIRLDALKDESLKFVEMLSNRDKELNQLVDQINQFNTSAAEFDIICDLIEEELGAPVLVDSIPEITDEISKFDEEVKGMMDQATEKYTEVDSIARDLMNSQEELAQNAFMRYNLNTLYERWMRLTASLEEKDNHLRSPEEDGIWGREHRKDHLRKEFAETVSLLIEYNKQHIDKAGKIDGTLDEQLVQISELKEDYLKQTFLNDLQPLHYAIVEAGILVNPYTEENLFTASATWEALFDTIEKLEYSIRDEISKQNGLKISDEQMKEIREIFNFFDVSKDGMMGKDEFWSCCTAIGLVITEDEMINIFNGLDVDGSGYLKLDEFSSWMAERLTTKGFSMQEVITAFDELAAYPPVWPKPDPANVIPFKIGKARIDWVCRYNEELKDYIYEFNKNATELDYNQFANYVFSS